MYFFKTFFVCCIIGVTAGPQPQSARKETDRDSEAFIAFPDQIDYDYGGPDFNKFHIHHHHEHHHEPPLFLSPEWHAAVNPNSRNNPTEKRESNKTSTTTTTEKPVEKSQNSTKRIPLEFILDLNRYTVNDLLANYVDGIEEKNPLIQDRFGGGDERGANNMPAAAACIPELTKIKIGNTTDPSILYIPQCTRVERCGGCCTHALLSCQPTEDGIETLTYSVIKTQYTGGKRLKYLGKEPISVEKHTKCHCDCKIKEKDCNRYQEYRKSECRCACKNIDEETKCYKNNFTKLWDPQICACRCRNVMQCSTGYYYDQNDCKCIALPTTPRRNAYYERKGYKSTALPVLPLYDDE